MSTDFVADIDAVANIKAVPTILEVVCETTGMGFAVVARVTEDRWIACGVRDGIAFGLQPGGELKIETTFCKQSGRDGKPSLSTMLPRMKLIAPSDPSDVWLSKLYLDADHPAGWQFFWHIMCR